MEAMTDPLDWADKLLDAKVRKQIGEIRSWVPHRHALVLIHGEAGRFVAALIGLACGRTVYRPAADDTFKRAAKEGAILFFESPRSDRAANQQVAYLLQRIEDYPGIVILASNLRSRLDAAFARRFQAVIRFKVPASWRARRRVPPKSRRYAATRRARSGIA